jgi:hypothetical protein
LKPKGFVREGDRIAVPQALDEADALITYPLKQQLVFS